MKTAWLVMAGAALVQSAPASAQEGARKDYTAVSAATAPVADAYFDAYVSRNWDALEILLAEDASFQDPTATHIFGGVLSQGRQAMMQRFRMGYAGISHMEFVSNRRLYSGETAIYEGVLHWGLDLGDGTLVDSATPMVILLTVENGKVVRHRDYVDYAPFVAAVRKARSSG
ncbi:nuclear transport factor 2 family protein [Sphingosinithalassobacter portus]|uniref:nuclear transport factor 2 family protein n=1 Tax=Stakelama portus TaxID=2676234 RepID=UPI000D6E223D|nr:nuclear transport factor 2 family protein [Sphingosinithalassobacter portus]